MLDAYDEVLYPSVPRNQTHPAHIAALAKIAGLDLPPVENWRVLEIGCGDGSNLIPLAADYPEASFIGVDRAKESLKAGQALSQDLHLGNIDLQTADLLDWHPKGEFDYIVAHGVYSWVPPHVRERILSICAMHLKPLGLAYISYNALPGCHFRRFAWDFLRFHARCQSHPKDRVEHAREIAQLVMNMDSQEPLQSAIRKEMEAVLKRDVSVLYHDDLSELNDPFYLLDFVHQAARHELQYLGDAEPERDAVQGEMPLAEDWLEIRQYGDFLAARRFRETLLCRRNVSLDRKLVLDRFRGLYAASRSKPEELTEDGRQRFALPNGRNVTTNHPFAKDLLTRLSAMWPDSVEISESLLGVFPEDGMVNIFMRLLQAGALELRSTLPQIAASVTERPVASTLARGQVSRGCVLVTNQRHMNVELGDEISRKLLSLMDGSRTHEDLARELALLYPDAGPMDGAIKAALIQFHRLNLLTG